MDPTRRPATPEKMGDTRAEHLDVAMDLKGMEAGSISADDPVEEARMNRLLWKIDLRIVPILGGLYVWCLIDRTNLGGARIAGIDEATGLSVGNRASIVILVFFIGYIIFELPSNMLLQKFGPHRWLSFLCFGWGITTLCIGFVRSWQVLAVLRVLLGVFEAGMFPGCIYLLSAWYRRAAVYFLMGSFCSSFANILAYGLTQIASDPERDGWKWIFIVEGAITVAYAALCWFIIPDLPYDDKKNKWLRPEEKALVRKRLGGDTGAFEEGKITWKVIRDTVKPPHMWGLALISLTGAAGTYSFLLFLPIILRRGLEFSLQLSFLLTAPPAAFTAIYAFGIAFISDKTGLRGPFIVLHCILTTIGLCMIAFVDAAPVRYAGAFFGQAGVNGMLITANSWGMNNVRGDAQRSVYAAWVVSWSSIGGIYSALVFRQQDAPNYRPGVIATLAITLATLAASTAMIVYFKIANKQAQQGKRVIFGEPDFRFTI
ncbi:hypothetical protein B0A52_00652 [Exophiala mesophila]|uniref:Major facilitator superfamily (MFS) profile domain-containing protein n=1 Tax=Exophiala mesophila TaxID=212818 RepID=A0A438NHU3_EXOME|nr:hypothetical protein B0A52_00652 [Exophiala mesophila]